MTYTAATVDGFRGLDLSDPMDVAGNVAVSLLDVDLDQSGKVRMRDGNATFGGATPAGGGSYVDLLPLSAGILVGVRHTGTTVYFDTMDVAGTKTNRGSSAVGVSLSSLVALGTPTATLVFAAFSGGGAAVREYNNTTQTVNTRSGAPYFLGVTPADNRLVQARFDAAADGPTGANGSTSTVFFSDPGAPTTWSANNYVHLRPGDGEAIEAVVTWREMLFVFKRSNVFIFYGTSTDNGGNPVFNYRTVTLPAPLVGAGTPRQAVAGANGVYFATAEGIYVTAGGTPERVSTAIDPIFTRDSLVPTSLRHGTASGRLSWGGKRLYYMYTNAAGTKTILVMENGEWVAWSAGGGTDAPVHWDRGDFSSRVFIPAGNDVRVYTAGQATDQGSAINWHWQGGFSDLGDPAEKVVRETVVWGTGTPTVSIVTDVGTTDSSAAAVTLGTSPAVAEGYHRVAYAGNLFSLKLSGSTAATVNRATMHIREKRLAGAKS